jgi:D-glycero-alpha-D-manno-heptose-7-phosphate kinase
MTGDIDKFGTLMHEHWLTKKKISGKMSTSNIDTWYDLGLKHGALGGKLMGAGGGGFLLFCVKNGQRKILRKAMENAGLKYMDFKFDFEGVKVLGNF